MHSATNRLNELFCAHGFLFLPKSQKLYMAKLFAMERAAVGLTGLNIRKLSISAQRDKRLRIRWIAMQSGIALCCRPPAQRAGGHLPCRSITIV